MAAIHSKNTKPEVVLRGMIYRMGYRYRLHVKDLPGTPDLVFRGRKKAIFLNGCFWHQHKGCKSGRVPKSNIQFWLGKLQGNVHRDEKNLASLSNMGWEVLVIWECQLKDLEKVEADVIAFLGPKSIQNRHRS